MSRIRNSWHPKYNAVLISGVVVEARVIHDHSVCLQSDVSRSDLIGEVAGAPKHKAVG